MTIYNSGKPKNKPSPIEVLLFGYVKKLTPGKPGNGMNDAQLWSIGWFIGLIGFTLWLCQNSY